MFSSHHCLKQEPLPASGEQQVLHLGQEHLAITVALLSTRGQVSQQWEEKANMTQACQKGPLGGRGTHRNSSPCLKDCLYTSAKACTLTMCKQSLGQGLEFLPLSVPGRAQASSCAPFLIQQSLDFSPRSSFRLEESCPSFTKPLAPLGWLSEELPVRSRPK